MGQIVPLGNSKIDVSSAFSLNGKLRVNGIELKNFERISSSLGFEKEFDFDDRCTTLRNKKLSFVITSRDVLPPTPEDLRK